MAAPPANRIAPHNAFAPRFLDRLAERETEPATASEAFASAAWRKGPHPELGHALRHPAEGPDEPPFATFFDPHHALLAQAILPATGRTTLWRLGTEGGENGFPVFVDGALAGYLRLFDPDAVAYLNVADLLTRNPQSLAFLLEATSGIGLEHAGRYLDRALRSGEGLEEEFSP